MSMAGKNAMPKQTAMCVDAAPHRLKGDGRTRRKTISQS